MLLQTLITAQELAEQELSERDSKTILEMFFEDLREPITGDPVQHILTVLIDAVRQIGIRE